MISALSDGSSNCSVILKIQDLLSLTAHVKTVRICDFPLCFPLKCCCDGPISQELGNDLALDLACIPHGISSIQNLFTPAQPDMLAEVAS